MFIFAGGRVKVNDGAHDVLFVGSVTVEAGGYLEFETDFVVLHPLTVSAGECVRMKNMRKLPCTEEMQAALIREIEAKKMLNETVRN